MIWTGSYRDDRLVPWLYSLAAMFLAVIAVIVLLSITANSAGRFIKDWRYITDAYIDAQASPTGERGTVSQVVRAHKPENFTEELELVTFGEGTHFSVHSHPDMGNGDIVTHVATIDEVRIGKRPLPYPPQSMWV